MEKDGKGRFEWTASLGDAVGKDEKGPQRA
jgi:hypothetical protein